MSTEFEAIKAAAKEAITEWLETSEAREAITAGARSAVLDWIELTSQGGAAVSWGAEQAVATWIKTNDAALYRTVAKVAVGGKVR